MGSGKSLFLSSISSGRLKSSSKLLITSEAHFFYNGYLLYFIEKYESLIRLFTVKDPVYY